MRRDVVTVLLGLVSLMGLMPRSLALAQDSACITPAAREVIATCPATAPSEEMPPSATDGATSHLAVVHRPEQPATTTSTPGLELDPHDEALGPRAAARALELLLREVSTLERMVSRGAAASAQHADYLTRLAETELELQTYWRTQARGLDQRIFDAQQAGDADALAAERAEQEDAETHAAEARDAAIHAYAQLVEQHPEYPQLDQALFSLAFGLGEAQQFHEARQVYLRLIRDFPTSRYVPHAWLSFAEYYFEQSDMDAASQFYDRVLETPPEAPNPVYGYALYKQAWVRYNVEDFQGALTQFARVIEFAEQHPDAHDAASLARQARHELVLPYARVGRPSQALAFFRRYAASSDQALEMLESLGELYQDTGHWPEAIQVFHLLMSERPASDSLCRWQSRVTSAVVSSRPKPEQVTEVQRLVDVMNAFARAEHPAESIALCRQTTAGILVELATAWHREAIGDGDGQPGTNDRATMRLARQLYELVTSELPDMEQLQYPDIDRRDWPTLYRVSYFYAELLWRMDEFGACGPAFDRVVSLDPSGPFSADAAYATVLCYDRVYQTDVAPRERERTASAPGDTPAAPRALTAIERGMLGAFQRYLCTVADGDERTTVQYRLARVYYEARHFEEASVAFRAVAVEHPGSELGEIAANLHLDSLEAIRRRDGRESCIASVRGDIEPLAALYCATDEAQAAHVDLCPTLEGLRCDVLRLDAERLAGAGDHARAAPGFVAIARDHASCGRRDEMLWNAAIEYEAGRLLGRAIQVRQALVEGFPESVLARRAVYLIGANYHALAIYSSAADWYERFAREQPDADEDACSAADRRADVCAVAHVALQNAVFFRLGLGETDQAIADAELFERSYRRSRPRDTAEVVFSLGAIYERRADWAHVLSHHRAFLRDYGRVARADEIMRADVQMGRASRELDQAGLAGPHFRAALAVWDRGAASAIAAAPGTDDEHALWLARAREAASEAHYWLAEERFEAFRAIHFPRFSGQRTLASVRRWSSTALGPWLTQRFTALRAAEQAYDEIAPLAVPEWQIAAAARVGEMYRSIVEDVRSAPVPEEIESDDELYGIYVATLEHVLDGSSAGPDQEWDTADDVLCTPESAEPGCAGAPIRQATDRFRFCLTLATRVRWFDDHSAACERELNAMDAAAYPMAAELRGTPVFGAGADTLAAPGAVGLADDDET